MTLDLLDSEEEVKEQQLSRKEDFLKKLFKLKESPMLRKETEEIKAEDN